MAARQIKKATKKAVPAARKTPARRAADKPKAPTSAPASMSGPLPSIVTLKHLAEWAGYDHGVPKKQATAMLTGFVADIGRALKKGSKIRIPNLGILQVRMRPARPARKVGGWRSRCRARRRAMPRRSRRARSAAAVGRD